MVDRVVVAIFRGFCKAGYVAGLAVVVLKLKFGGNAEVFKVVLDGINFVAC